MHCNSSDDDSPCATSALAVPLRHWLCTSPLATCAATARVSHDNDSSVISMLTGPPLNVVAMFTVMLATPLTCGVVIAMTSGKVANAAFHLLSVLTRAHFFGSLVSWSDPAMNFRMAMSRAATIWSGMSDMFNGVPCLLPQWLSGQDMVHDAPHDIVFPTQLNVLTTIDGAHQLIINDE